MTARVAIRSCHLNGAPVFNAAGDRTFLARITAELGPVMLAGCILGQRPDGGHFLQLPSSGRDRRVIITDRQAYADLLAASIAAYEALGGPALHNAAPPLATAPQSESVT